MCMSVTKGAIGIFFFFFRLTNNENEIVFSIRTMNVYSIVLNNLCNMFKKSQWSLDNSV
jgi:hypothetical protein